MDRRMYDGCPSSELKAEIAAEQKSYNRLKAAGYKVVYWPVEGGWSACDNEYKDVSGVHDSIRIVAEVVLK